MSGITCVRNIHKLLNRLSWTPVAKTKHVNLTQNICRSFGTSNSHNLKIITANRCKEVEKKSKNWVSYGFSDESEYLDKHLTHLTLFVTISICLTLGSFVLIYLPDFRMRDWYLREAYLELRRRESEGLPPISPDLIDPDKVILPTDEELGDTEIII